MHVDWSALATVAVVSIAAWVIFTILLGGGMYYAADERSNDIAGSTTDGGMG